MSLPMDFVLRGMAWDRAKGELASMLRTFSETDFDRYEELRVQIDEFIKSVEGRELEA